ncbi:MAG: response regulator [Nitrospirota bacterium]|nr:response regulator [Nitrospirota bacterium]
MKKIIIAENILKVVGSANSMFRRGGIEVHPAKTSEELLALHRQHKADIIITDFALPVMGGARLCAEIRGDDSLKNVSIILACEKMHVSPALCGNAGANAMIEKPVDPVELFIKVSELIAVPPRRDMRVMLRVAVSGGAAGSPSFATSQNISISGMLLESAVELKPGDQMDFAFTIGHTEIKVTAKVMRVEATSSGRYQCGVKFVNLDTKSLIVIEQYVKSRSKS